MGWDERLGALEGVLTVNRLVARSCCVHCHLIYALLLLLLLLLRVLLMEVGNIWHLEVVLAVFHALLVEVGRALLLLD